MTKQTKNTVVTDSGALTHSPFASLKTRPGNAALPSMSPTVVKRVTERVQPRMPPPKVRLRLETAGRSGKVVTRITGLPSEGLETIAARLRKALGCGATVDGEDVLILGSLVERATQWLDNAGDLRAMVAEKAAPGLTPAPAAQHREVASKPTGTASGMKRSDVQRGRRVAIVMKADQESGRLTEGVVRDLLTNSETHPRGIKVRLETGEIGRVKVVLG